jgi:uncharacterized protein YoxC
MEDQPNAPESSTSDHVLQQQFRRALSSFEGIILSQIDIKNKLGDRLNYSIQAGIIILGVISVSILVLLLTLSAQINRISGVVAEMNHLFTSVASQMSQIRGHMGAMEQRVSLLESIETRTAFMDGEMGMISSDMDQMRSNVEGINTHVGAVSTNVSNVAVNMDLMNLEVQAMSTEVHRVSQPARSMNKMFPFP